MKAVKKKAPRTVPDWNPEPMVFEHAPVENAYDRIAKRVMAAVAELNAALDEANECAEMRVFIGTAKPSGHAMAFEPVIYRMTHATLTMMVKIKDEPMAWRHVKDDAFEDVAGVAFGKLKK